jgi:DNA repair photolyase
MKPERKPERAIKLNVIQPRSVLNRSGMGGFTLNPYAGCVVGCAYCLEGETLIAIADGTAKPIKDVLIGEAIIGVRREDHQGGGWSHRYTQATVLNKIETLKPAYEVVLENGTRVICSGDHRWLTDQGWKYTITELQGEAQQPHLTVNDFIIGKTDRETSTRIVEIKSLDQVLSMYDIATSTENFIANGLISHNCYVPHMKHKQLEERTWGTYVDVKEGVPELLEKQLARLRQPTRIFMSSATDPYQPVEERYQITRRILEVFARHPQHSLFILTKQQLVERDADLIARLPRAAVGMSISVMDDAVAAIIESWAAPTSARLATIQRLSERGIPTYLLWAPAFVPVPMTREFVRNALAAISRSRTHALSLDSLNYRSRQPAGLLRRLSRERHAPATQAQVQLLRQEAERLGLARRLDLVAPESEIAELQPLLPFE